jgi:hypothetical protein
MGKRSLQRLKHYSDRKAVEAIEAIEAVEAVEAV